MATVACKVRVRKNGLLSLPKAARDRLHLTPGEEIEIQVEAPDPSRPSANENPLYRIIGIASGGRHDGAENHDYYLYRDDAP